MAKIAKIVALGFMLAAVTAASAQNLKNAPTHGEGLANGVQGVKLGSSKAETLAVAKTMKNGGEQLTLVCLPVNEKGLEACTTKLGESAGAYPGRPIGTLEVTRWVLWFRDGRLQNATYFFDRKENAEYVATRDTLLKDLAAKFQSDGMKSEQNVSWTLKDETVIGVGLQGPLSMAYLTFDYLQRMMDEDKQRGAGH